MYNNNVKYKIKYLFFFKNHYRLLGVTTDCTNTDAFVQTIK